MLNRNRIIYGLCILYNLVRLPIISLLTKNMAKFGKLQLIRPGVEISLNGAESRLDIKKANILKGTVLQVDNGHLEIGKGVFINRNCNIVCHSSISIGDGTTIGPNVCIYDHDHSWGSHKNTNSKFILGDISIGNNVWIGAGAIILRGSQIGDGAIIGAGVVFKGNLEANTLVKQDCALKYYELK